MKRIASLAQRINHWMQTFVKSSGDEYQLGRYIVPEYQQVKQAHQLLLSEYVRAIAVVSRLSFFVGLHEIQLPQQSLLTRLLYLLLVKFSFIRLITLKPLVRYFVETHISSKLSELSVVYVQTGLLIQNSLSNSSDYSQWLTEAKQQCIDFQETLLSGRNFFDSLKSIGTSIIVLLLAALGVNSLGDLALRIFSNSMPPTGLALLAIGLIFLIVVSLYVYIFWDSAFGAKRTIFMGIGSDLSEKHNVYVFENELFRILGRGKSKEWPMDYLFPLLFLSSAAFFLLGVQSQVDRAISMHPNTISLPCFSIFAVPVVLLLIVDVILPWRKRYAKGNM